MTQQTYRPNREPAKSIYEALAAEMELRGTRTFAAWQAAEGEAVLKAAQLQATRMGVAEPTIEDIRRCETQALGHIDYASQWAYAVADMLQQAASRAGTGPR